MGEGGYLEACGGAAGNVGSFTGLTLQQAQDACCQNTKCAGFDFRPSDGSGYYKSDQNCGKVSDSNYEGYTKPSQMPLSDKEADITVTFSDLGLSGDVTVYDIWAQKKIGVFQNSWTAKRIAFHGSAFLRLSSSGIVI